MGSSPHSLFSKISHFLSPYEARVFLPSSGSGVRGLRARETRPCPLPQICYQHPESLLSSNPERDGPAPDLETSLSCHQLEEDGATLQPEPGQPGPSEEAEEGAALQQMVVGASPVAAEQALCSVAPAAPGPQDQPAASPSLRALEQVRDPSGWARGTAASCLLSTCRVQTPCSVWTGVLSHKSCMRVPGRLPQRAMCCLHVLEAASPGTRCRLGFC